LSSSKGKTIALMQPYFFPYLGYYQLLNLVDEFIIYDDVQYIKGGWINRNRILQGGEPAMITIPVNKGSLSDQIVDKQISLQNMDRTVRKLLKRIDSCYKDAPFFDSVLPLIRKILGNQTTSLAEFLEYSIKETAGFLGIDTSILISSSLEKKDLGLKGQKRVLHICSIRNAATYINAIGGRSIYQEEAFSKRGITLQFLKPEISPYVQNGKSFVPNLSILDVMMYNDVSVITEMLKEFEII